MAVELGTGLAVRTQVTLPATLAFDYPTPNAIIRLILSKFDSDESEPWSDDVIRRTLEAASIATLKATGLLRELMSRLQREGLVASGLPEDIGALSEESLFDLMEGTLRGDV
jgi:hypothetical protein